MPPRLRFVAIRHAPGLRPATRGRHPDGAGRSSLKAPGWWRLASPARRAKAAGMAFPPSSASPPPPEFPHPPAWARAGLDVLAARDPRLAPVEAAAGPLPWRTRRPGFPGLLRAIRG